MKTVEDALISSNGSAKHYVSKLITDIFIAGEEGPDFESAKKMENVLRKAIQEYKNKDMPSTNWITNLQYVAQTCRITLECSKIKGYVQKLEVRLELFKIKMQHFLFIYLIRLILNFV